MAHPERGAAAMLVALLTVVLLGITAFVTDLGYAYAKQRLLQNGADAAALSVAHQIARDADRNVTCSGIEGLYNLPSIVTGMAGPEFEANAPTATLATPTVKCETIPGFANDQVVVTVAGEESTSQFFGGILGVGAPTVTGSARAILGTASPYGMRPFAICEVDALELATQVSGEYVPHTVVFPKPSEAGPGIDEEVGCGSAKGNAGLLDLDAGGGGRGTGPTGCEGIKGWVECGFDGTLPNPSLIPGQSGGFGGSVDSEMEALQDGEEFPLPVYDKVSGNGSATYSITGFVMVAACAWDFQTKSSDAEEDGTGHELDCYDETEWKSAAAAAAEEFGGDKSVNFLQLKYVRTVSAGELDGGCSLGDASCDFGTRAVVLGD